MIYIITPSRIDFLRICETYLLNPHDLQVVWVNMWEKMVGRKLYSTDSFIKGDQYYEFNPEEIERIEFEIKLRLSKECKHETK